jgi:hypothetical protein
LQAQSFRPVYYLLCCTLFIITLEQAVGEELMADAVAAGRIPPYTIARNVALVSLADETKLRDHPDDFFEHPLDRSRRLESGDLVATLIFLPGGRIFTKRILARGPALALPSWEIVQRNSKLKSFESKGPWLDHLVYAANMRIGSERDEERNVPGSFDCVDPIEFIFDSNTLNSAQCSCRHPI